MYTEDAYHNKIDLDKIVINLEPPTVEPARQYYYMDKCRELVKDFEQKNSHFPKTCVVNFGCPVQ